MQSVELREVDEAVEACNAVAVPDPIRQALVKDLTPIAQRLSGYKAQTSVAVLSEEDAQHLSAVSDAIFADIKLVKNHEVLSKITGGLHTLHKRWTGLRDMFVAPMERDRKIIKDNVIAWQEAERKKAAAIQAKLQQEADLKAQREREKAEAEARRQQEIEDAARRRAEDKRRAAEEAEGAERAKLKAAASAAERAANTAATKAKTQIFHAASVAAPTVTVHTPKSGLRTRKVWKVKAIDEAMFYTALATRPDLRGYIEIKHTNMERSKAANPSMEIPGVEFEQKIG